MTLTELADKYGTDKGGFPHHGDGIHVHENAVGHHYTEVYARYLDERRESVTKVLELGTWSGQSARMWRDYFPNAEIHTLDIEPREPLGPRPDNSRITFHHGDESNAVTLGQMAKHGPFDLIVDDGSHISRNQIFIFDHLWEAVKPGGLYVCEDLHTQWKPGCNALPGYRRSSITISPISRFTCNARGAPGFAYYPPDVVENAQSRYVAAYR